MALTDTEKKQIHEIIRFELRRERDGICCPDCGEQILSAAEFDRRDDTDRYWSCSCGFDDQLREFDNAVMRYE